jgi:hypothetical protein
VGSTPQVKHATPRLLRALRGADVVQVWGRLLQPPAPARRGRVAHLPAGRRAPQVAAGWQHSLALAANGEAFAWGDAVFGALGVSRRAEAGGPPAGTL